MKLKKKILIVDNGFLAKDGESYFANSDTNKFLNDLDKIFLDITLSQFHKKINPNENILNSKVNCNILSTNFRDSNLLEKVLSYIKLSVLLTSNIYKYDLRIYGINNCVLVFIYGNCYSFFIELYDF